MTFKKGDKVRVKDGYLTNKEWVGTEGVLLEDSYGFTTVKVSLTKATAKGYYAGYEARLGVSNLELIEEAKTFKFKDIQKGDTIRRTVTTTDGSVITTEGTVTRITSYDALSSAGVTIVHWTDDQNSSSKIELVSRPEKPKELWEKAEIGESIVREDTRDGELSVFTKIEEDKWVTVYLNNIERPIDPDSVIRNTQSVANILSAISRNKNFTLSTTKKQNI